MKRVHSRRRVLTHYSGPAFLLKKKKQTETRWVFVPEWKFPAPAQLMETGLVVSLGQKNDGWHRGI